MIKLHQSLVFGAKNRFENTCTDYNKQESLDSWHIVCMYASRHTLTNQSPLEIGHRQDRSSAALNLSSYEV